MKTTSRQKPKTVNWLGVKQSQLTLLQKKNNTMALLASIQFGDNSSGHYSKTYLLTDYHLHFMRHHNSLAPDSEPQCERIDVTVVAPGKIDLNLHEWYINQSRISGRIVFDVNSPLVSEQGEEREVRFENAQCFAFEENYQIGSNNRRLLTLSLVAESVTIGNNTFSQEQ